MVRSGFALFFGIFVVVVTLFGSRCTLASQPATLGAMALRTSRLLQWDAEAMRIANDEQAGALVDPSYRDGWSL